MWLALTKKRREITMLKHHTSRPARLNVECFEGRDLPSTLTSLLSTLKPQPGNSVAAATAQVVLPQTLSAENVGLLLDRAAAASASTDAIIAVVDRNGRILGVRVESSVSTTIVSDPQLLTFAVDGAVAKARTAAFFANNQAPLTSRTIQFISQTTMTEQEINSNPNITDVTSTFRGLGFVAPVGIAGHFPPRVPFTPQVDLFAIEHTNRDGTVKNGVTLPNRFNVLDINLGTFEGQPVELFPPDSYGYDSGVFITAQARGIATLPGGVPIFQNNQVVGGIGVFFPGTTGFATEENSVLSSTYDRTKLDRSAEAEWIAFAAEGGIKGMKIGAIGNAPALPPEIAINVTAIQARIDLVGITLNVFGPGGAIAGPKAVMKVGSLVGRGDAHNGMNIPVSSGDDGIFGTADDCLRDGKLAADGWLVVPHASADGNLTAADVEKIIDQGIAQAKLTRAAIRAPKGERTKMVFSVTDKEGNVLGLYRMKDATVFSEDVAVAKARNVAYYANANALQPIDKLAGIPAGTAFTNRTFRYLALPRLPEGIDTARPGPFSILTDGHVNIKTGKTVGTRLQANQFQSVQGYDAFNPGTNFRDNTTSIYNQNGVVFFPGSAPLYKKVTGFTTPQLVGGFGVSGDGVDQDDVVTSAGQVGFTVPSSVKRADQVFFKGIRLPYQKYNRNPQG